MAMPLVSSMLGQAGYRSEADKLLEELAKRRGDPNAGAIGGAPEMQAPPGDPGVGASAGVQPTPLANGGYDYGAIAQRLSDVPQLANALPKPEVAGGQTYNQLSPQVSALQAATPSIAQILSSLFRR